MKQSMKIGIVAALVAMVAVPMVPAAASAAPAAAQGHGHGHGYGTGHGHGHGRPGHGRPGHAAPTKSGPTSIAYVEVNNDELANVGRYTLANGANAFDVAIIFAANINYEDGKAVLVKNENVQRTLDQAATQIRPLQAKGIKVSLSVLGNHQGAGLANFTSKAAARDFAAQVAATVKQYGLDGVDLDDEYSDYGVNGTPQPNQQSIGWLISALRADMPGKLISFYDIGPSSDALKTANPSIGKKLDYAWNPYYGTYTAPTIPGLPKSKISAAAVDIQNTPQATAVTLAQRTKADGYGVFMTYNLPGGDESAYVSSFTNVLYGQAAVYQ
ncbi:chitinase [Curtobacterium sp. MMLR14_010]|uniref:endo-beta-N-acetylglucosaminidase H n=1 Tax=Curtobacterium sp. MMLR14_010 TaxID=1898743 RepID=UPI0008DDDC06|nr:endo-beta-N-acetylglucosaminidase H [Curtobacterium sp. MMLR14_010]OII39081.1 chitinase [Curtobacterium sp. MMLR14_010]